MAEIRPEIMARIKLYSKEEGSPRTQPLPRTFLNCTFRYKGQSNDCRLILDKFKGTIELGTIIEMPIKFFCPELIVHLLKPGDTFYLWRGGNFAEGTVITINTSSS